MSTLRDLLDSPAANTIALLAIGAALTFLCALLLYSAKMLGQAAKLAHTTKSKDLT